MARKIAFIHKTFPFGGAEKVTIDISRYFHRAGYEVYIFAQVFDRKKITSACDDLNLITLPNTAVRRYDTAENAEFIARRINELGIDIFVIQGDLITLQKYVRENSRAKVVFALHSKPMFEVRSRLNVRKNRMVYKGNLLSKLEYYLFRLPFYKFFRYYEKQYLKKYCFAYENSDAFTVLVERYREDVIKILKLDPLDNHIYTIRNFLIPSHPAAAPKKNRVLYMGRLNYPDKRVDRLVDIWSEVAPAFPQWELLIVGEGTEKETLCKMAEDRNIERIHFYGYTTEPDKYYQQASVLAITSEFEGWPLVVAEAQEHGVVPIAYDASGGIIDQIGTDGECGVLVPSFDRREYVSRLSALLADDERRIRLSNNAREKAKTYDVEQSGRSWVKLFDKLLSQD